MLPTVARYLEHLPRGVDSFPYAQIKGGVVRAALERARIAGELGPDDAPSCALDLVREPPAVNAWVPEVHYSAVTAAIYDLRFRKAGGLPAYEAWVFEGNLKLLRGPLYRVLFLVTSIDRIFSSSGSRWSQFHRGSIVTPVRLVRNSARIRLSYPPGLFVEEMFGGFGMAFRAGCVAAGTEHVDVSHHRESDGATLYDFTWT